MVNLDELILDLCEKVGDLRDRDFGVRDSTLADCPATLLWGLEYINKAVFVLQSDHTVWVGTCHFDRKRLEE